MGEESLKGYAFGAALFPFLLDGFSEGAIFGVVIRRHQGAGHPRTSLPRHRPRHDRCFSSVHERESFVAPGKTGTQSTTSCSNAESFEQEDLCKAPPRFKPYFLFVLGTCTNKKRRSGFSKSSQRKKRRANPRRITIPVL